MRLTTQLQLHQPHLPQTSPSLVSRTLFLPASPISPSVRLPLSFPANRHAAQPVKVLALAKRGIPFKQQDFASAADLHFDPPLTVIKYPDPLLRAKNKPINTFDDALKKLVAEMFDVMYKTDGIGLSAPQVGKNVQLMVFNAAGEPGVGEEIVLVNPRMNKYSQTITRFNEGCLSFPGIYGDVKGFMGLKCDGGCVILLEDRPKSVKVDARDISGSRFTISLSGLPARVFQHEYDHLEGILFFERMTEEVLNSVRSDLQDLEKKYEDETGCTSPERIDSFATRKVAVGFGKS